MNLNTLKYSSNILKHVNKFRINHKTGNVNIITDIVQAISKYTALIYQLQRENFTFPTSGLAI